MRPALRNIILSGGKKPVTPAIQAAHAALIDRVQQLEAELKKITDSPEYHGLKISEPGAIGHNNPPESIVENPLDAESVAQLQNALATIKAQAASPNDRGRQAKNVAATLNAQKEKWSEWLARHGNTFVDAASKEAGKRSIQWVHGAIVLLYAYLAGLTDLIAAWVRLLS